MWSVEFKIHNKSRVQQHHKTKFAFAYTKRIYKMMYTYNTRKISSLMILENWIHDDWVNSHQSYLLKNGSIKLYYKWAVTSIHYDVQFFQKLFLFPFIYGGSYALNDEKISIKKGKYTNWSTRIHYNIWCLYYCLKSCFDSSDLPNYSR